MKKKILVVNVNWVGDVVFSVPVFKALKKRYPRCHLACLAVPRVRDVLAGIPAIDEIILFDERGRHWTPLGKLRLIWELRRRKFDTAFLLHRSWTRALLIYLSGIRQRVGYDTKGRGMLLTHRVKPLATTTHRSDYYSHVVESFGLGLQDRVCDLRAECQAKKSVQSLLASRGISVDDFVIAVNTGGNWDLKRWPKENFVLLVNELSRQFCAKVIIPGAKKDIDLASDIACRCCVAPIVLAGLTNLQELTALLERANMLITADSGPLHLASAVGTTTIALFGPTRPEITGPRGKGLSTVLQNDVGCNREPCYYLECPENICMKSITVRDVTDVVRRLRN